MERSAAHAVVDLDTRGFYARPDGRGRVQLFIPGFEDAQAPGAPAVPVKLAWLEALPVVKYGLDEAPENQLKRAEAYALGTACTLAGREMSSLPFGGGRIGSRIEDAINAGGFLCGAPEQIIEHLKKLEERYPGLERVSVSLSVGVPQAVALEQLERFATEVMPAFKTAVAEPAVAD